MIIKKYINIDFQATDGKKWFTFNIENNLCLTGDGEAPKEDSYNWDSYHPVMFDSNVVMLFDSSEGTWLEAHKNIQAAYQSMIAEREILK